MTGELPVSAGPQRTETMHRIAQGALIVGAVASIAAMLLVARRQRSAVLLTAFIVWDLAPFVLLGLADHVSAGWRLRSRTALHYATVVVALATLVAYGAVVAGAWHGHPAAPFLIVPPVSILFAAIVLVLASGKSARRS